MQRRRYIEQKKADVTEYPCGSGHVGLFTDEPPGKSGLDFNLLSAVATTVRPATVKAKMTAVGTGTFGQSTSTTCDHSHAYPVHLVERPRRRLHKEQKQRHDFGHVAAERNRQGITCSLRINVVGHGHGVELLCATWSSNGVHTHETSSLRPHQPSRNKQKLTAVNYLDRLIKAVPIYRACCCE